jgi:hypothetical protein
VVSRLPFCLLPFIYITKNSSSAFVGCPSENKGSVCFSAPSARPAQNNEEEKIGNISV